MKRDHPLHSKRVIEEILDPVDAYVASLEESQGPWYYRSLTVRRQENLIIVSDSHDEIVEYLSIGEFNEEQDSHGALEKRLNAINGRILS